MSHREYFVTGNEVIDESRTVLDRWNASWDSVLYTLGGVQITYAADFFDSDPFYSISLRMPGNEWQSHVQYTPIVTGVTPTSITIRLNKNDNGLVTEPAVEDNITVVVHAMQKRPQEIV